MYVLLMWLFKISTITNLYIFVEGAETSNKSSTTGGDPDMTKSQNAACL